MLFIVTAMDKDNSLELRMATRLAHFEYARDSGAVRLGGPFLDAKGEMIGSMIVIEAADLEQAQLWAKNDPYAKAGLFKSSMVRAWKPTFNPNNMAF